MPADLACQGTLSPRTLEESLQPDAPVDRVITHGICEVFHDHPTTANESRFKILFLHSALFPPPPMSIVSRIGRKSYGSLQRETYLPDVCTISVRHLAEFARQSRGRAAEAGAREILSSEARLCTAPRTSRSRDAVFPVSTCVRNTYLRGRRFCMRGDGRTGKELHCGYVTFESRNACLESHRPNVPSNLFRLFINNILCAIDDCNFYSLLLSRLSRCLEAFFFLQIFISLALRRFTGLYLTCPPIFVLSFFSQLFSLAHIPLLCTSS